MDFRRVSDRSTQSEFQVFIHFFVILFSYWILRHDLENRFLCCWRWNAVTWLLVKLWRVETLTLVRVLNDHTREQNPSPFCGEQPESCCNMRMCEFSNVGHFDSFSLFKCLLLPADSILHWSVSLCFCCIISWLVVLIFCLNEMWVKVIPAAKLLLRCMNICTYASLNEYWRSSLMMMVDSLHGCYPSEEWDEPRRFLHDTEEPTGCTQSLQTGKDKQVWLLNSSTTSTGAKSRTAVVRGCWVLSYAAKEMRHWPLDKNTGRIRVCCFFFICPYCCVVSSVNFRNRKLWKIFTTKMMITRSWPTTMFLPVTERR